MRLDHRWIVGDRFVIAGVIIAVEPLYGRNAQAEVNCVSVSSARRAGGGRHELALNDVLLDFRLPAPYQAITLKFGDYGGDLAFAAGRLRVVCGDFDALDGAVLERVSIAVVGRGRHGQGNGTLSLVADSPNGIRQFAIGGRQLYLGDVCLAP